MTMKITQLITHWQPDEALATIQFLDELRDLLWRTYGEEIIQNQMENLDHPKPNREEQLDLRFDDRIPF